MVSGSDTIRESKGISINLIGCCAIRDIFGLHENDGGYNIIRFVQDASPLSIVTEAPLIRSLCEADEAIFSNKSPFWARCQKLELQKKILDYISEDLADYLIFDVAEFRRKLLFFKENQGVFSENYYLKDWLQKYIETGLVPASYEVVNPMEMDRGRCVELLHEFCDSLLELYDPDRIILVEIKAGLPYTTEDKDSLIAAEIKTAAIFNERMSFAYDIVRDYMPEIHVVEFPENIKIDPHHKWGRNLLHYTRDYYDYALDAVNAITTGG